MRLFGRDVHWIDLLLLAAIVFLISVMGIAAVIFLYCHDPVRSPGIFPQCPLKQLTGFWCAGCGSTRAAYAYLHGNFVAAVRHNILLPFLLFFAVGVCIRPKIAANKWVILSFFAVIVLFTVLRNIPCAPFTYLNY